MFVLSVKNGDDDPAKYYFDEYYMPLVESKDFNALIEDKLIKEEPRSIGKMSRNNSYRIGNLLDYLYHQIIMNWYRFV